MATPFDSSPNSFWQFAFEWLTSKDKMSDRSNLSFWTQSYSQRSWIVDFGVVFPIQGQSREKMRQGHVIKSATQGRWYHVSGCLPISVQG